jgi:protein transport protein DSL1/ZW10
LSAHAALAQQTQDTETTHDAMECLLQCRKEYDALVSLANDGRLADAVETSTRLQGLLDAAPPALTEAEVFSNLKVLSGSLQCLLWPIESFGFLLV